MVNHTVPSGHPCLNVQSALYWSATTNAGSTDDAWDVSFFNGDVRDTLRVWCVCGGMNADAY